MNDTEIKPCPFCGNDAELVWVGAHECFIKCRRGCVEQIRLYPTKGSAARAWNRRSEDNVSNN